MNDTRAPRRSVELATVIGTPTAFKDGGIANLSDTYRGQILLQSGATRSAFLKDIPQRELANEVMAAALAFELGLAVPDGYIAAVTGGTSTTKNAPRTPEGIPLLFASADVAVPSIAQVVSPGVDATWAIRFIAQLILKGDVGAFYGFDSWVANIDRHIANLLFDGQGQAWLIDHGRCFTGPAWVAADLDPGGTYRNRLKEWLTPLLPSQDKPAILASANVLISRLAALDIRAIGIANDVHILLGDVDFGTLVDFLRNRIQHTNKAAADALGISLVI